MRMIPSIHLNLSDHPPTADVRVETLNQTSHFHMRTSSGLRRRGLGVAQRDQVL